MPTEPEAKRRKIRKGTTSCWECKRRKIKCDTSESPDGLVCKPCARRGLRCVGQELPDEGRLLSFDGIENGLVTPVSSVSGPGSVDAQRPGHQLDDSSRDLSVILHQALPSRQVIEAVFSASRHPAVLAHGTLTLPYATLHEQRLADRDSLLQKPLPGTHPVLVAKYTLILAFMVHHLAILEGIDGVPERPRDMAQRLATLAAKLITTNDNFLRSIEALECVMIESLYHSNVGNVRRSWLANRRAMSIAQLMGIDQTGGKAQYVVLDPRSKFDEGHMWFRIVSADRYLSLMIGVTQGSLDASTTTDASLARETPLGRLERIHCDIASRILERNRSGEFHNDTLTQVLDSELQQAASDLTNRWWLIPALETKSTEPGELFWDTRRLFSQVYHYSLIQKIHLPYMLCSKTSLHGNEQSRMTCMAASREILSRSIALRRFDRVACSCRTIDFLTLMAAMALLIAHLCAPSFDSTVLAHQRHTDRALVEEVRDRMTTPKRVDADPLSEQSAELLGRLLQIFETGSEADRRIVVQKPGTDGDPTALEDDETTIMTVPYIGVIKIVPKTAMSLRQNLQVDPSVAETITQLETEASIDPLSGDFGAYNTIAGPQSQPWTFPYAPNTGQDKLVNVGLVPDTDLQYEQYPSLAAGSEDWALHGVDAAFFESLMANLGQDNIHGTE